MTTVSGIQTWSGNSSGYFRQLKMSSKPNHCTNNQHQENRHARKYPNLNICKIASLTQCTGQWKLLEVVI